LHAAAAPTPLLVVAHLRARERDYVVDDALEEIDREEKEDLRTCWQWL